MDKLSLQNPVFATYVIAASIMILKAVSMSWLTVVRMMQVKGRLPLAGRHQKDTPQPGAKQEVDD
jgi:glutathione S-transferase